MIDKQFSFIWNIVWNIIRGSIFWLIGNFIYVFLHLNALLSENINELGTLIITGLVLIPLVFSPGTVAAFSCFRSFFYEDNRNYWQLYKASYKNNYRIAFKHGCIFLFFSFLLYSAYWYYGKYHLLGRLIPIFLMSFVTILFLFILLYTSDREESFVDYWKLGSLILVNHPIFALFMITEICLVLFVCRYIGGLLLIVAPGAILLIVNYFYRESIKSEVKKLQKNNC